MVAFKIIAIIIPIILALVAKTLLRSLSVVLERVLIGVCSSGSRAELLDDELVAHEHLKFPVVGGNTSLTPVSHIVCVGPQRSRTIQGKINAFNVTTPFPWNFIVIQFREKRFGTAQFPI